MTDDLALIKELEKEIGKKLPRHNFANIMSYRNVGFAADDEGRVTGLNLEKMEIKAIPALLPRFQNLEKLDLYNNQIRDISPLAKLTNLTELDLENNQISDISPLETLTNLTILEIPILKRAWQRS